MQFVDSDMYQIKNDTVLGHYDEDGLYEVRAIDFTISSLENHSKFNKYIDDIENLKL